MKRDPISYINNQTRQETLVEISPDFPYCAFLSPLHTYPNHTFPWHWHRELELFYVQSGQMEYHLPQGIYAFQEGQGGFLNANVLHKVSCQSGLTCTQEVLQFPSEFIAIPGSRAMEKYVRPIVEDSKLPILRFDPEVPDHQPILSLLRQSYSLFREDLPGCELDVQGCMLELWKRLFYLTASWPQEQSASADDFRLKQMLSYITVHFSQPIRLEDIANAAAISPRACERCFRTHLDTAPLAYLTNYRLHHACELLSNTNISIKEIAKQCGFHSNSYFTRLFGTRIGITPQTYRLQAQQEETSFEKV